MNAGIEFKCYSKDGEFLGRCIAFNGNERSEFQYLFETLILGRDLGRNPYQFNIHQYNEVNESKPETDEEPLPLLTEQILEGSYVLTDIIPENERSLKLLIGLHYIGEDGEFYVLKVPVNTSRVVSESLDLTFKNESGKVIRAAGSSYILIFKNAQYNDIKFGPGTITTRSYLISENISEVNPFSYLANGSKFPSEPPLYLQNELDSLRKKNFRNGVFLLNLPIKGKVKVTSRHEECWNDFDKFWRKGDIMSYQGVKFECIVDYANNSNLNDASIWRMIYETN